ncbi:MAG: hypothetical protein IT337_12400 [Thermomicrobiales bacterium]|nr:hypothetical protein [Thermomicrobiales bacterium]
MTAIYFRRSLPLHWIVEHDDALWIVPARHCGWRDRKPYVGPRAGLRVASWWAAAGLRVPGAAIQ